MVNVRVIIRFVFLIILSAFASLAVSQEEAPEPLPTLSRGSIPEALLRPARGETPRYPVDTVIGELGRGRASESAFAFANSICEGLLSGDNAHASLSTINSKLREGYLATIEIIGPLKYRIGGGREEADGAFSFLVRFMGREQGITGELYVRYRTRVNQQTNRTTGAWIFEELLLDEAREREIEQQESIYRYDFNPYERFF